MARHSLAALDPGGYVRKQAIYALRAAHALARAHGHEWGGVLEISDLEWIEKICVAWEEAVSIIAGLTEERSEYPCAGIRSPSVTLDQDGWSITHTTGTGRVTWTIDSHWRVQIDVHRPGGRVIGVTIPILEDGTYGPADVCTYDLLDGDGAIYQRHIDALRVCLDALGCDAELPPALPDPVPEGV